jgi:hypothetical protein
MGDNPNVAHFVEHVSWAGAGRLPALLRYGTPPKPHPLRRWEVHAIKRKNNPTRPCLDRVVMESLKR